MPVEFKRELAYKAHKHLGIVILCHHWSTYSCPYYIQCLLSDSVKPEKVVLRICYLNISNKLEFLMSRLAGWNKIVNPKYSLLCFQLKTADVT